MIVRLTSGFLIAASLSVLGCAEENLDAAPGGAGPAASAAGGPAATETAPNPSATETAPNPSAPATAASPAAEAAPAATPPPEAAPAASAATPAAEATPAPEAAAEAAPAEDSDGLKPVAIANGKAALSPANTSIGFVGTHKGDKPDPRIGGFEKFSGTAKVDPASKALKSATIEIQADSVWTQFGKLTTHLKTPDFFDVREHPTVKFVSKSIAPGARAGEATITGDLTLHGVTKPVTILAKVDVTDAGLTLSGAFNVDRSEFGMDRLLDRVDKDVTVTVAVGMKTEKAAPAPGPR